MNIDIHSFAIFMSITNILQVIALFTQYRLNKIHRGLGWWTLGTACVAVGFGFSSLRDHPVFGLFAIVANNVLFISGFTFIHVGVLRFFGQREKRSLLIIFNAIFTLIAIYFTYLNDDLTARRLNVSIAAAIISLLIAWSLFTYKSGAVTASADFLAIAFFANAFFFTIRALTPFFAGPVGDIFTASLTQVATYLDALIISMLWTFGFVILVNQRLNAENRETRNNQELIFNTTPDLVWVTNMVDGSFIGINDGFSELTGFTRADLIGKTSLEVNFWHDLADLEKVIAILSEKRSCKNQEAVFLRKDGTQIMGVLSAKIMTLQGAPHIISVMRDITERKQAEQALMESEAKHRILFRDSPDAYLIIKDGIFVDCNRASELMLRGDRSQIIGKPPEVFSPEFQPNGRNSVEFAQEKIKDALRTGINAFEWVHRKFDGTNFFVDVTIAAMRLEGKPVLFTTWRDITVRKRAENALYESEQRYRLLAESNTEIVWQLSQEISERKRLETILQKQASTDELTGLFNRRHFITAVQLEYKRTSRFKHSLAIALIDLDHFKQINDNYGHAAGDQALIAFSKICQKNIREIDVLARFGGDEFALLLPETDSEQARQALERVHSSVMLQPLILDGKSVSIRLTAGFAISLCGSEALDDILIRADQSLYKAKEAGRNRIGVEITAS